MSRAVATLALLASFSACGPKPAPKHPIPDPKRTAAELDAELAEVAAVIHRRRADCPAMARELRVVFERMRQSIAKAHRIQLDDAAAKQMVIEMHAYDAQSQAHTAAIDADFSTDATCAKDREVREVLMSMPTL